MKKKRMILGIIFASIFLMAIIISDSAFSQEKFPSKPITIIVPFAPGAGTDTTSRLMQKHAGEILGKPITVINKIGASGSIGMTEGANAPPDGYTVTVIGPSLITRPYTANEEITYKKVDPLISVFTAPCAITVRQDAPWKDFKEFIDYAKRNPGKIRISNNGRGSLFHLGAVAIEVETGIKVTHLPFTGTGPAVMAIIGGHVEAGVGSINSVMQLIKSGKLRALATFSKNRYFQLPDVPTAQELGVDLQYETFFGFAVPKGTPKERVKIINDAFKKAMTNQSFENFAKTEALNINYLGPEEFVKWLGTQDKLFLKLIEFAGLRGIQ
jgi:tripartite-type tricarboxylate transporter receptor subunit TctC